MLYTLSKHTIKSDRGWTISTKPLHDVFFKKTSLPPSGPTRNKLHWDFFNQSQKEIKKQVRISNFIADFQSTLFLQFVPKDRSNALNFVNPASRLVKYKDQTSYFLLNQIAKLSTLQSKSRAFTQPHASSFTEL